MNAKWEPKEVKNRQSGNFYGVFETNYPNVRIRAILSMTPTLNEFDGKRILFAHIYFYSENITDGLFHDVSDDIYEIAMEYACNNQKIFKTYFCEYYSNSDIAYTSGDYTYSN